MVQFFVLLFLAGTLGACTGAGVTDAEGQARAAQANTMRDTPVGFSVWSLFSGNEEIVHKRLDGGLGKTKAEESATFGEPFQCNKPPAGGEVCGWYDGGMSSGGITDSSQHRVFYTFDKNGKASEWSYQGLYGKHNSRDAFLPQPGTASQGKK